MKIIISHDIDHITFWEHYKDAIIPKHYVRSTLEYIQGRISSSEFFRRFVKPFNNKWQNIEELMDFNDEKGIKTNFFIGVNNGVGLNYSLKQAEKWIKIIQDRNFEIGVHGIDFNAFEKVKKEHDTFSSMSKSKEFGIRMHYLRQNDQTFDYLSKSGYLFDSTEQAMKNPYKIGDMWEFPLQIMEGWVFYNGKRQQENNLEQAKITTLKLIEECKEHKLSHLNLLFHDCYYNKQFNQWKQWYEWVIDYFISEGYEFTTYHQAVKELNS